MSYAANLEDELAGLDIDELPAELREQARQEKRSQGGYRFDSPAARQHIKDQRAAIWGWLRGLGANLIKHGVNLTKVPLPVELCEPRSFLERLTDSWAYLDLLHAAAAATDPVERLKLVVAFVVGGMRQQVSCDKPFNPILGETLQGVYPCGCSVAAEQISHHPPISCWQIHDHAGRFEFTGSSCWSATFTGNSVRGSQTGESAVRFASDGATVTWSLPSITIRGVLFGERVVKYQDTITFRDQLHGLVCELSIDPHAPKRGLMKRVLHKARHPRSKHVHDQLMGELARITHHHPAAAPGSSSGSSKKDKGSSSHKCSEQLLDSCSGTWLTDLTWDKGVRSTILPDSFDTSAAPAGPAAAAGVAVNDDDDASVGCHSIGGFSTTSGSTLNEEQGEQGDEQQQQQQQQGQDQGQAAATTAAAAANGISSNNLTASTLAAHTSSTTAAAAAAIQQQQQQQQQQSDAADVSRVGSSAALCSSEGGAHRSGRGISVVKQLWTPNSCKVFKMRRLSDQDPLLLPSDSRYRPDVMALSGGARHAAQHWKLVLEQLQRADRALRGSTAAAAASHHHHHRHSSSRGSEQSADAAEQQQLLGA